jgi:hypothetical protein
MKRLTQKEIILNLLRSDDRWFASYELMKANTKWGWIGSQGDRRAREMAEAGQIEVRHEGKYAEYHAYAPKLITEYRLPNGEIAYVKREY